MADWIDDTTRVWGIDFLYRLSIADVSQLFTDVEPDVVGTLAGRRVARCISAAN